MDPQGVLIPFSNDKIPTQKSQASQILTYPLNINAPLLQVLVLINSSHKMLSKIQPDLGKDYWICLRARQVTCLGPDLTKIPLTKDSTFKPCLQAWPVQTMAMAIVWVTLLSFQLKSP